MPEIKNPSKAINENVTILVRSINTKKTVAQTVAELVRYYKGKRK